MRGLRGRLASVDDDFDLSLHVHRIALPAPGDERALQELVGDLMASDLDHDRPLWEIHLVEDCGAGCALVIRLHHCVADGIALTRVLLDLTDGHRGDATARAVAPPQQAEHSAVDTLLAPAHAIAGAPLAAARRLRHPDALLDLGHEVADACGVVVLEGYGMTETTAAATLNTTSQRVSTGTSTATSGARE